MPYLTETQVSMLDEALGLVAVTLVVLLVVLCALSVGDSPPPPRSQFIEETYPQAEEGSDESDQETEDEDQVAARSLLVRGPRGKFVRAPFRLRPIEEEK
jgi:hypothetical protein